MNVINFSDIIQIVLKHEGGARVSKDPDDPGGVTKYGISKKTFPQYDIENLSEDDAVDIYKRHFWEPSKAGKVAAEIRLDYFDACVNMGQGRAVKILQQTVNASKGNKISVDGRIGPQTIAASKRVDPLRFRAYRILHYAKLIAKNPTLEKYYFGWFRRSLQ